MSHHVFVLYERDRDSMVNTHNFCDTIFWLIFLPKPTHINLNITSKQEELAGHYMDSWFKRICWRIHLHSTLWRLSIWTEEIRTAWGVFTSPNYEPSKVFADIFFSIFFIPALFRSTIHDPMRKTENTNIKPHISIYVWLSWAFPLTSQCNTHLYVKPKCLI